METCRRYVHGGQRAVYKRSTNENVYRLQLVALGKEARVRGRSPRHEGGGGSSLASDVF